MVKFFVSAPHWLVFLIIFGVPVAFHISLQVYISLEFIRQIETRYHVDDPMNMMVFFDQFKWALSIPLVYQVIGYTWIGSVVYGLRKHIPINLQDHDMLFRIILASPLLYLIVYLYFFFNFSFGSMVMFEEPDFTPLAILYLMMLLLIPAGIYLVYYTAKTLKTAELNRPPKLAECIPDIVLIWFYPIGIWFLQPRINDAVNEKTNDPVDHLLV